MYTQFNTALIPQWLYCAIPSLQNSILLQDLANSKADMEKQLKEKTEEAYHVYQQVADLMEEKKVLMDIVHQLCVEAGRQIDVV